MATYKFQARKLWSWGVMGDFLQLAATFEPAKAEVTAKLEMLRDHLFTLSKEPGPARHFFEAARCLFDRLFQRQP